ncbi:uncharacterized protein C1orf94 homolog isoform X3 [Hyla sarda]|uniref:uncharacterized protein C1orf94 homolog isoform X3 n=1 Tax=Hyla sarda TaxID=327740 RepID=UPI0024C2259B|nr:uncharacterized protein C1orf94 homolog isoform X3 [Hyla sarda]
MSIKECDRQAIDERAEALKIENAIKSVLAKGNSNKNLPLKAKKCYIQDRSSSQVRRLSLLDKEDTCYIEYTKMEARKLLAQFPKKSTYTNNTTIAKTKIKVVENRRKNIFTVCSKEGSTCKTASKDDKNQHKVFAKLCAKGYHHSDSERPIKAVASVTGSEANNRNMKQAGPGFMPPTSSVPEMPENQPYMSNFPPVPFFWMPHGMHYGQFQQVTRHVLPLPYHPMMYYMHYMHLTYQMRGPGIRGYPRMAGDGPRYPLLPPYSKLPPPLW